MSDTKCRYQIFWEGPGTKGKTIGARCSKTRTGAERLARALVSNARKASVVSVTNVRSGRRLYLCERVRTGGYRCRRYRGKRPTSWTYVWPYVKTRVG